MLDGPSISPSRSLFPTPSPPPSPYRLRSALVEILTMSLRIAPLGGPLGEGYVASKIGKHGEGGALRVRDGTANTEESKQMYNIFL